MDDSKPHPDPKDYHEGPEAARRFQDAVRQILAVPREEYAKRHKAWEKAREKKRKSHCAKAR